MRPLVDDKDVDQIGDHQAPSQRVGEQEVDRDWPVDERADLHGTSTHTCMHEAAGCSLSMLPTRLAMIAAKASFRRHRSTKPLILIEIDLSCIRADQSIPMRPLLFLLLLHLARGELNRTRVAIVNDIGGHFEVLAGVIQVGRVLCREVIGKHASM